MRAGTCAIAAASTSIWSATMFDPALPGRSSIARHSRVFASQAPSGRKPNPFLNAGAAPSFSECAVTRVASMSMTSHPFRVFPAISSHGNPADVAAIRFHTCARTLALAFAILPRVQGSASSSVRRTVVSLGAAPSTGSTWASTAISHMLAAPLSLIHI